MASTISRLYYLYCESCREYSYFQIIGYADGDVAIIRFDCCGQTHLWEGE